jgi:hypothetical protein
MSYAAPVTAFRNEAILGFERRQSLLRDTVTTEAVIKGNKATFLVASSGGATASTRGANGLISSRSDENTQYECDLKEKHDLVIKTHFDIFASQGNQREIAHQTVMSVLNRDIDAEIITALESATSTTSTATAVTVQNIGDVLAEIQEESVDFGNEMFGLVSPKFYRKGLMSIPEFAKSDYVDMKPFVDSGAKNVNQTSLRRWNDVIWIMHTGLTGMGTATETCLFYHKQAIGHAVDKAGMVIVGGENDEQAYHYRRASLNHGAKLLQNAGVYKFIHNGA